MNLEDQAIHRIANSTVSSVVCTSTYPINSQIQDDLIGGSSAPQVPHATTQSEVLSLDRVYHSTGDVCPSLDLVPIVAPPNSAPSQFARYCGSNASSPWSIRARSAGVWMCQPVRIPPSSQLAMSANLNEPTSPTLPGAGSTSSLYPGIHNIPRGDFRSSFRADLMPHVLIHDGDTLWDRFLVPFLPNPSESPSGDQELVNKVVTVLKTTCLQELNAIQEIQAAPTRDENRMMKPLVRDPTQRFI